jgi:hypothetical protein
MVLGFSTGFADGTPTNFVEKILKGEKITTIRKGDRWRPGMRIHMATGVRTINYIQFNQLPRFNIEYDECTVYFPTYHLQRCVSVQTICIDFYANDCLCHIYIDGKRLHSLDLFNELAINDGFKSFYSFFEWFKKNRNYPNHFTGQIIHWTDKRY